MLISEINTQLVDVQRNYDIERDNRDDYRKRMLSLYTRLMEQYALLARNFNLTIAKHGSRSSNNNINDFYLNNRLEPDADFWTQAESSFNAIYPGAIAALHQITPLLSEADIKFIMLVAMQFPDYIICLYLGLYNVRSVDNRRRNIKAKFGNSLSIEDWLKGFSFINLIGRGEEHEA